MKVSPIRAIFLALISLSIPACGTSNAEHQEAHHEAEHKILVTSPVVKDVISTQEYVCQIHSRRHIEVCALEGGYLEEIPVKEGQAVKEGQLMFKILPVLFQAKLDSDMAEAQQAQIEYNNTKALFDKNVVSQQELSLVKAKLAKAQAKVKLAQAELNFTEIRAPFDGIMDRLHAQLGSLIDEGDVLTTLSDNSVMWVYYNVPEARYLEYKAELDQDNDDDDNDENDNADVAAEDHSGTLVAANDTSAALVPEEVDGEVDDKVDRDTDGKKADEDHHKDKHDEEDKNSSKGEEKLQVELVLANHQKFPQVGKISAIEADFNNETGNIAFRSDFSNPQGLLRHGQTGTILIHRNLKDALVIPQRATFEILAKRYVYVIGKDNVVRQREITIKTEMDDIFVIDSGLKAGEKIILEGIRQVRDGEKVEYEFRDPVEVLGHLKNKAE